MSDLIKLQPDAVAQVKKTTAGLTITIRSLDGTALALVWIETRKDNDVIIAYTGDGITDEIPQHTEVGVTRVPLVHSIPNALASLQQ